MESDGKVSIEGEGGEGRRAMNFLCRVHGPNGPATAAATAERRDHRFETATSRQIDRLVQRVFHFHAEDISRRYFYLPPLPSRTPSPAANLQRAIPPSIATLPPLFRQRFFEPTRLSSADKYYSPRTFDSMNSVVASEGRGGISPIFPLFRSVSTRAPVLRTNNARDKKEGGGSSERSDSRIPIAKRSRAKFFLSPSPRRSELTRSISN